MTGDIALLVSLFSIACALWLFLHTKKKNKKVHDKARKLKSLEKAVKNLSEEMKDV